jgi:hypothetical protein
VRAPIALFGLALAVRAIVVGLFPDPAYPDSYYYVDVARQLAAGHGLTVDFVWIFAELGNRIPSPAVLPIPSNAHWLPLASFLQAPFIALLGPTAVASAIPGVLIGSLAAPLTWAIARDAGARRLTANAAGVLIAIPGAATVFMAQPETLGIAQPIVAAALWFTARALKGDARWLVPAWAFAGILALARNDGVLLAGTIGLIWLVDRLRWMRARRGRGAWSRVDGRQPLPMSALVLGLAAFLLIVSPWWLRQLATFGSISPTTANGVALWLRDIGEWNSVTSRPTLETFLAQGPAAIATSRIAGLGSALVIFAVLIASVALVPFLALGMLARRNARDFVPWFAYATVLFVAATLVYPLHVPGGTFLHTAIGLAPHAAILSIEGILLLVAWIAGRRRRWEERIAGAVIVWGVVALVAVVGIVFGLPVIRHWDDVRQARQQVAAELDHRGVPVTDRLLSIDAAGYRYWTGRPGVVIPNDPLPAIEDVARAYAVRWLVIERDDAVPALAPALAGSRPPWIGPPILTIPAADAGLPQLALLPICFESGDTRCVETPSS